MGFGVYARFKMLFRKLSAIVCLWVSDAFVSVLPGHLPKTAVGNNVEFFRHVMLFAFLSNN